MPESFGFAQGQVTPFGVKTADGESLYAWHVMPLGLWAEHDDEVLKQREQGADDGYEGSQHDLDDLQMGLLRKEDTRVVLNCKLTLSDVLM